MSSKNSHAAKSLVHRVASAIGPILGGLIIDAIDFASYGPLGVFGFFAGAAAGLLMTAPNRMPAISRLLWAGLSGLYCLSPFTEFIPLGTIVGAFARYLSSKKKDTSR